MKELLYYVLRQTIEKGVVKAGELGQRLQLTTNLLGELLHYNKGKSIKSIKKSLLSGEIIYTLKSQYTLIVEA